jgi:hypothetical protein
MKTRRLAVGAKTGAKNHRSEQPGSSYRQLPLKIKAAIASDQCRTPRKISLPPMRWLEREVLR